MDLLVSKHGHFQDLFPGKFLLNGVLYQFADVLSCVWTFTMMNT